MQHVYISYPPEEYELAHRLVDDLQAAGYVIFVDAVSGAGTMAWAAETRRAIRASGAVIIILSPAEGRHTGVRHEAVLARRRNRPVFVLQRTPGDIPRYMQDAVHFDFSGEYEAVLPELLAALPDAATLLKTTAPLPRRFLTPPPRTRVTRRERFRRRMRWLAIWLAALTACILLGIAVGLIPV